MSLMTDEMVDHILKTFDKLPSDSRKGVDRNKIEQQLHTLQAINKFTQLIIEAYEKPDLNQAHTLLQAMKPFYAKYIQLYTALPVVAGNDELNFASSKFTDEFSKQNTNVNAILIQPVQRSPRHIMLFEDLEKNTNGNPTVQASASRLKETAKKTANAGNEAQRLGDNQTRMSPILLAAEKSRDSKDVKAPKSLLIIEIVQQLIEQDKKGKPFNLSQAILAAYEKNPDYSKLIVGKVPGFTKAETKKAFDDALKAKMDAELTQPALSESNTAQMRMNPSVGTTTDAPVGATSSPVPNFDKDGDPRPTRPAPVIEAANQPPVQAQTDAAQPNIAPEHQGIDALRDRFGKFETEVTAAAQENKKYGASSAASILLDIKSAIAIIDSNRDNPQQIVAKLEALIDRTNAPFQPRASEAFLAVLQGKKPVAPTEAGVSKPFVAPSPSDENKDPNPQKSARSKTVAEPKQKSLFQRIFSRERRQSSPGAIESTPPVAAKQPPQPATTPDPALVNPISQTTSTTKSADVIAAEARLAQLAFSYPDAVAKAQAQIEATGTPNPSPAPTDSGAPPSRPATSAPSNPPTQTSTLQAQPATATTPDPALVNPISQTTSTTKSADVIAAEARLAQLAFSYPDAVAKAQAQIAATGTPNPSPVPTDSGAPPSRPATDAPTETPRPKRAAPLATTSSTTTTANNSAVAQPTEPAIPSVLDTSGLSNTQKGKLDDFKKSLQSSLDKHATAEQKAEAAKPGSFAEEYKKNMKNMWEQTKRTFMDSELPKDENEAFAQLLLFLMQLIALGTSPGNQLLNTAMQQAWDEMKAKYHERQADKHDANYNDVAHQEKRLASLEDLLKTSTYKIADLEAKVAQDGRPQYVQELAFEKAKHQLLTEARDNTEKHLATLKQDNSVNLDTAPSNSNTADEDINDEVLDILTSSLPETPENTATATASAQNNASAEPRKVEPIRISFHQPNQESIPFEQRKSISAQQQADMIIARFRQEIEAEPKPGRNVAITYSANNEQANDIYNGYESGLYKIEGGGQAKVMELVAKAIISNGWQDRAHILPVATSMRSGGDGAVTATEVNRDLANIAKHVGAGWTVLGYQNEYSNEHQYAIGGGYSSSVWKGENKNTFDNSMVEMSKGEFKGALKAAYDEGAQKGVTVRPQQQSAPVLATVPPVIPPTPKVTDFKAIEKEGEEGKNLANQFFVAILNKDDAGLKALLTRKPAIEHNLIYPDVTLVNIARSLGNSNAVNLLTEHGADIYYANRVNLAKEFGHIIKLNEQEVSDSIQLRDGSVAQTKISAEYSRPIHGMQIFREQFNQFHQNNPNKGFPNMVNEAMDFTREHYSRNNHGAEKFAERIASNSDAATYLPSGYSGHNVGIIYQNGKLVVCDGADKTGNIHVYDVEKLSENQVSALLNAKSKDDYVNALKSITNDKKPVDLPAKGQKVSNCSYVNVVGAVEGLNYVNKVNNGTKHKEAQKESHDERKDYNRASKDAMLNHIEKMMLDPNAKAFAVKLMSQFANKYESKTKIGPHAFERFKKLYANLPDADRKTILTSALPLSDVQKSDLSKIPAKDPIPIASQPAPQQSTIPPVAPPNGPPQRFEDAQNPPPKKKARQLEDDAEVDAAFNTGAPSFTPNHNRNTTSAVASVSQQSLSELIAKLDEVKSDNKLASIGIKGYTEVKAADGKPSHVNIQMYCNKAKTETTDVKAETKPGSDGVTYSMKGGLEGEAREQTIEQICALAVETAKPGTVLSIPSSNQEKRKEIEAALDKAFVAKFGDKYEKGNYTIPDAPKSSASLNK